MVDCGAWWRSGRGDVETEESNVEEKETRTGKRMYENLRKMKKD